MGSGVQWRNHSECGGNVAEARERVITVVRREPLFEKTCPSCDSVFEGLRRQFYCSVNCANRASYARHAEKRLAEKREQYHLKKQKSQG